MTSQLRLIAALGFTIVAGSASAEVMTVRQVKELMQRGKLGELAATSYAQGVFDGMLAMEYLYRKETGKAREFCGIIDAHKSGTPIRHPAYRTKELLRVWEQLGRSMDAVFTDLALNYMSAQYGCKPK